MSEPQSYMERARALGASDAVIAALDLLVDDGMDPYRAAELVVVAERAGKDPEAFARHLLGLRRVYADLEAKP